jgi:hypothetical protein
LKKLSHELADLLVRFWIKGLVDNLTVQPIHYRARTTSLRL